MVPESGFRTWSFIWTHGSFTSCREPYPKVKFWNIISYISVITCFDPCEILNPDSEYLIFILFNWTLVPNFAVSKYYMRLVHTVHTSIYISLLWKANKIIRKKNFNLLKYMYVIAICENCLNAIELYMIYTAVISMLCRCCTCISTCGTKAWLQLYMLFQQSQIPNQFYRQCYLYISIEVYHRVFSRVSEC